MGMRSNLQTACEKVFSLPDEEQEAIADNLLRLPKDQQSALADTLLRMDYWDKELGPVFKVNVEEELQRLNIDQSEFEKSVEKMRKEELGLE